MAEHAGFDKTVTEEGGIKKDMERWAKAAGVRALRTVAQTAVATIGTTALISDVDWAVVASASLLAGVLSMLTSMAGLPEVDGGESVPEITERMD